MSRRLLSPPPIAVTRRLDLLLAYLINSTDVMLHRISNTIFLLSTGGSGKSGGGRPLLLFMIIVGHLAFSHDISSTRETGDS